MFSSDKWILNLLTQNRYRFGTWAPSLCTCDLRYLESHIVSLSFSVLAIISQTAIKPVAYKELKYVLTALVAKSSKTQGLVNSVSGEEQFLLIEFFIVSMCGHGLGGFSWTSCVRALSGPSDLQRPCLSTHPYAGTRIWLMT